MAEKHLEMLMPPREFFGICTRVQRTDRRKGNSSRRGPVGGRRKLANRDILGVDLVSYLIGEGLDLHPRSAGPALRPPRCRSSRANSRSRLPAAGRPAGQELWAGVTNALA